MVPVSIGLPVYNDARWVGTAIESLLDQTFTDFELLISDNASTDGTSRICQDYARMDRRIDYRRHDRNLGITENHNNVFQRATGRYFKWASSNDQCEPRFLQECFNVLEQREDVAICFSKCYYVAVNDSSKELCTDDLNLDSDDPIERLRQYLERVTRNNIMYGLIRSRFLRDSGPIKSFPGSDINLLSRLTLYGKFVEVPEFLFYRRLSPQHQSVTLDMQLRVHQAYDPSRARLLSFTAWRSIFENFITVYRAPLHGRDRLRLLQFFCQHSRWQSEALAKEILDIFRVRRASRGL